ARDERAGAGRGRRRAARPGQEPSLLRVCGALPGTGLLGIRDAGRRPREANSAAADARAVPGLLRHHRARRRAGRARADRRAPPAPRRDAARGALPRLRSPGVSDPERPAPAMDPDALQRRLFAIARRIVQADGQPERGVMLIEDLHWIDAASEAFLEQIVEAH